ncbi:MAG: GNAT family N-acetyltransferase [Thermoplasmata archaeon]
MAPSIYLQKDLTELKRKLLGDVIVNSGFLWRVFQKGDDYRIYATEDLGAMVAIQATRDHMIFAGNWSGLEIPEKLLPGKGVFVSASPTKAIDILKRHYELAGEWPCWHFLAPPSFGPGPWDGIGPIKIEEVAAIARNWALSDDPEKEMAFRVERFDSACIRVDGKPVSWCGLHFEIPGVGNMGFAHTLEAHRRKGYAAMVTKALVNRLASRGCRATVHVIKDNSASAALCSSMGFSIVGEQTWADFKARD